MGQEWRVDPLTGQNSQRVLPGRVGGGHRSARCCLTQMKPPACSGLASRREFIQPSGRLAAASLLAGVALPHVHDAGNETIQVALIS